MIGPTLENEKKAVVKLDERGKAVTGKQPFVWKESRGEERTRLASVHTHTRY